MRPVGGSEQRGQYQALAEMGKGDASGVEKKLRIYKPLENQVDELEVGKQQL